MKLTKKIVSLAAVLALSCTFAVSAAELTMGNIAEADGAYSVGITATGVAETDQYTVLVYKISDEGIADEIASATIPAPSNANITYINQDAFATIKADDAYTIAFALGANVKGDGTYKVMVGGTGVATAAVGYFEIGEDAPTYKIGDANGDGVISITDAAHIANYLLGAAAIDGKYVAEVTSVTGGLVVGDANSDGAISITDAAHVANYLLGAAAIDGFYVNGSAAN